MGVDPYVQGWVSDCLRFFQTRLFVKALCVAIPNGVYASILCANLPDDYRKTALSVSQVWTGYNFVLGFLVVFRTTHAYGRFWEGATLLHQMRGEWFNAISSLFAFSSTDPDKREEVVQFQNFVIRLASMLHCAALQDVSVMEVKNFATLEIDGMDPAALQFLQKKAEKCEVLLQWIQRLVVEASLNGVVPIAPPILSRAFQELSRGIVNLNSAKRITDIPFPLPYTIMIRIMLCIQWIITPIVCALVLETWWWAAGLSMITVFAFTSTVHIAAEIENPFGDDQNDLPLADFQFSFNQSLLTLLDNRAQMPPFYAFREEGRSSKENVAKKAMPFNHALTTDLEWLNCCDNEILPGRRYSGGRRPGMLDAQYRVSRNSEPFAHMPGGARISSGRRSGALRGDVQAAGVRVIGEAGLDRSQAHTPHPGGRWSEPPPKLELKLEDPWLTAPSVQGSLSSPSERRQGSRDRGCNSVAWWDEETKSRSDDVDEMARAQPVLQSQTPPEQGVRPAVRPAELARLVQSRERNWREPETLPVDREGTTRSAPPFLSNRSPMQQSRRACLQSNDMTI